MANRVKDLMESIVYAGMKPGARSSEDAPAAKQGWFTRWLNGPEQSDPLYLTNQTFGQKARRWLFIALPVAVVIGGGVAAIVMLAPKTALPPKALTAAEVSARVLPEFDHKEFALDTNHDLEVTEVRFEHSSGNFMVGNLHNKSNHPIVQAVVVFALANAERSELGAVTLTELNLAAGASREFRKPIEQGTATYALVREVDTK
jgi:hypothetical protein